VHLLVSEKYGFQKARCNNKKINKKCRISFQNKFEKLVHLFGFIVRKFVTMHGHMNVKKNGRRICGWLKCRGEKKDK
jgi:hypothetical protein